MSNLNLNKVNFNIEKYHKSEGYAICFLEIVKQLIEPNEEVDFTIEFSDKMAGKIATREFVIEQINKFIANRDNIIS